MNICYKKRDNRIHRINPAAKLLWALGVILLSLYVSNPIYLSLLLFCSFFIAVMSDIMPSWAAYMKFSVFLALTLMLLNIILSPHGATVLFDSGVELPVFGTLRLTAEALIFGAVMSLRIMLIISVFALFNFTTNPDDLLASLVKLRIPYKSVFLTSLSSRFVHLFHRDAETIKQAQMSRGLELEKGSRLRRLRSRIAVLIPLLSNSLDRSLRVAEAMEARAFGHGKRTFFRDLRIRPLPVLLASIPLFVLAFVIVWGYGLLQFYPQIDPFILDTNEALTLSLIAGGTLALFLKPDGKDNSDKGA